MKVRIDNIYDDGLTLFSGNTLLQNDERLSDIMALAEDLDLIAEEHYGARELLRRMVKEDNTDVLKYDITKINRHIYATMVENLTKYSVLLANQSYATSTPDNEYHDVYVKGENIKTYDYDSRVDTTKYGTINVTETQGATSVNNQTGARENTASVTSFSSNTFNPTDKNQSAQATDVTTYNAQTNTGQSTRGNDQKVSDARQDKVTDDETTDTRSGYKNLFDFASRKERLYSRSVLDMIVVECVNSITYSMYL